MLKAKKGRAAAPTLTDLARAQKEFTLQKRLNVDLDEDIYDAFNILALKSKTKMAKLVREWITDYVEKHSKE